MSGMDFLWVNRSEAGPVHASTGNGTFSPDASTPPGPPASLVAAVAEAEEAVVAPAAEGAWPRHQGGGDIYMYVWIFLGLLAFLLTLLLVSLHRLKNLVASSSSAHDCGGGAAGGGGSSSSSDRTSSFTNMEICSVSSQKSTISTLSH